MTVARVLRAFGHDVLAAGLAGGATGELIIQDLAKSGVPTAFTLIRGEPGARPAARLVLAGPAQARAGPGRGRGRPLDEGARRPGRAGSY